MATLQLAQMPHGYDLEAPSFFYWLRAGAAFTIGAGLVYVMATLFWMFLL